jgi:hypothetical protein
MSEKKGEFIRAGRILEAKDGENYNVVFSNLDLGDLIGELVNHYNANLKGKTPDEIKTMKGGFTLYGKKFPNTPDFVVSTLSVLKKASKTK